MNVSTQDSRQCSRRLPLRSEARVCSNPDEDKNLDWIRGSALIFIAYHRNGLFGGRLYHPIFPQYQDQMNANEGRRKMNKRKRLKCDPDIGNGRNRLRYNSFLDDSSLVKCFTLSFELYQKTEISIKCTF
jgi:hypothetical protein